MNRRTHKIIKKKLAAGGPAGVENEKKRHGISF
jgi:hypothetical protein